MGLDIPVADVYFVQVEEASEQLVRVNLQEGVGHCALAAVAFNNAVDGIGVVLHHNVEELLWALLGEERILHLEHIDVVELLEDFELPVFVLLILEDLFDGDHIEGVLVPAFIHHPEGPTADHLLKQVLVCGLGRLLLPKEAGLLRVGLFAVFVEEALHEVIRGFLGRRAQLRDLFVGLGHKGLHRARRLLLRFLLVGQD